MEALAKYRCPLEVVMALDVDALDDAEFGYRMRAVHVAVKYHQHQFRETGEPFFEHCLATAEKVKQYLNDKESYAAAVLHDVLEDCNPSIRDELRTKIGMQFGQRVERIDWALTKIDKAKYFDQVFQASSIDFEVPFIKLADRLHNLSSIGDHYDREWKERYFEETLGPMNQMFNACRGNVPSLLLQGYDELYLEVMELARDSLSNLT